MASEMDVLKINSAIRAWNMHAMVKLDVLSHSHSSRCLPRAGNASPIPDWIGRGPSNRVQLKTSIISLQPEIMHGQGNVQGGP